MKIIKDHTDIIHLLQDLIGNNLVKKLNNYLRKLSRKLN
jgi:hypothetical protein